MDETDDDVRNKICSELSRLGFDISDPHEIMKDLIYLRRTRTTQEQVGAYVRISLIGTIALGLLTALWFGIKEMLRQ